MMWAYAMILILAVYEVLSPLHHIICVPFQVHALP